MKHWQVLLIILLVSLLAIGPGCRKGPDPVVDLPDPGDTEEPSDPDNGQEPQEPQEPQVPDIDFGQAVFAFLREGKLYIGMDSTPLAEKVEMVYWSPDGQSLLVYKGRELSLLRQSMPAKVLSADANYLSWEHLTGHSWQPGGNILAYCQGSDLVMYHLTNDTEQRVSLGYAASTPIWSPQGDNFYLHREKQVSSIYIYNQQGSLISVIESAMARGWWGEKLIISRGEYDEHMGYAYYNTVELVNLQGTGTVLLENVWAPTVKISPMDNYLAVGLREQLHIFGPDLAEKQHLNYDTLQVYSDYFYPMIFDLAPQGQRLAYFHYTREEENENGEVGFWDLVALDLTTGSSTKLWPEIYRINGPAYEDSILPLIYQGWQGLVWATDGQSVYVLQEGDQGNDLYHVRLDGSRELVRNNWVLPITRP